VLSTPAQLRGYYRWHAHIYDATRWAFLFGRAGLIELAAQCAPPRRILEVGCGTGTNLQALARRFPQAGITGVDLSREMLAKARAKLAPFGSRIRLLHRAYDAPVSEVEPFDLIVFSYCLSMINPGYAEVLRLSQQDLSPGGRLAVVDFHDTRQGWFRAWMARNHVRMDGQVLAELQRLGFRLTACQIRPGLSGLWRWFSCLATRPQPILV
jgi:S-adenosylmethionine-diacylgycerolhomoserine-N-methlytransferase